MGVTVRSTNRIPQMRQTLGKLGKTEIKVGIFGDKDAELVKIARAHEFGVVIRPKRKKFLAVPLPPARGKRPRDFDDLVFIKSKDENRAYLMRPTGKRGTMKAYFILLKKVTIPERSFLRNGFDNNVGRIMDKAAELINDVLTYRINPDVFSDMLGQEFAGLIQLELRSINSPGNKPLTVANKKSDNPLVDSGRMVGAIRHKVE